MASRQHIAPFPSTIDRYRFGDWLSGFSDGEGCFRLSAANRVGSVGGKACCASFEIVLRDDDRPILEVVRSYFGCGRIVKHGLPGQNPQARLMVTRTNELATVVVPHFERHPLYAKKRNDYLVWKRAVALLHGIWQRPRRAKRGKFVGAGATDKWTPEERAEFLRLHDLIKEVRRYNGSPIAFPFPPGDAKPGPESRSQLTLFGD